MSQRQTVDLVLRHRKLAVCLLILTITAAIITAVLATRPPLARNSVHALIPAVETRVVQPATVQLSLTSQGILQPATEVQLVSQLAGRITYIAPGLVAGGSFRQGDVLLKTDPARLQMELQKARANLAQARLNEQEIKAGLEARSAIDRQQAASELASGKPQRELAEAGTAAALAAYQLAQQQLANSELTAPFNGRVLARNVELHEQLSPGMPIARIYASDRFQVRLPVTRQQLALVQTADDGKPGSTVVIHDPVTGIRWQGHIQRSEGHVAANRLVYLIAALELAQLPADRQHQVLPGSLVQAEISSRPLDNVIAIPAAALRANNTVWLLGPGDRLHIRDVELLYRGRDQVYLKAGLTAGERLITSHLAAVTEQMILRELPASGPLQDSKRP
ncbi:MAG TPA: efflux RND transporter periplasmic adaptor subunit [Pseudomonadales bacterium]